MLLAPTVIIRGKKSNFLTIKNRSVEAFRINSEEPELFEYWPSMAR